VAGKHSDALSIRVVLVVTRSLESCCLASGIDVGTGHLACDVGWDEGPAVPIHFGLGFFGPIDAKCDTIGVTCSRPPVGTAGVVQRLDSVGRAAVKELFEQKLVGAVLGRVGQVASGKSRDAIAIVVAGVVARCEQSFCLASSHNVGAVGSSRKLHWSPIPSVPCVRLRRERDAKCDTIGVT